MGAKTPAEVDALLGAALAAGDVAKAVSLYESGATLVNVADGTPAQGVEAIRAALEGFAALRPQMTMNVVKTIEAGDLALVFNDWSGEGKGADGQAIAMSGKALEVMRRQADGSWKYVIDDPNGRGA